MSMASSSSRGPGRLGDRALVILEVVVGLVVVAAIVGKAYGPAPTVIFLLAAIATAFTLYVGARMFSALGDRSLEVTGRIEDEERKALEHEKLLILQGIKELEADRATGKTDEADYAQLRRSAEARAVDIIRELKASDDRWRERAERLIVHRLGSDVLLERDDATDRELSPAHAAVRGQEPATVRAKRAALPALFDLTPTELVTRDGRLVCTHCDTTNDNDARFCVGCGRPRRGAAA